MTIRHFQFCVAWLAGLLSLRERQLLDGRAARLAEPLLFDVTHPLARRFGALPARADGEAAFVQRCRLLELAAEALAAQWNSLPAEREHAIFACGRFQRLISQYTEKELLETPAEKLAQLCNCTVRHFRALFRKQFGVSLKGEQLRMRLLDAAERLRETATEINALARHCGYRHPRSFAIAFKRQFGCTPIEWRQDGAPQSRPPSRGKVLTES